MLIRFLKSKVNEVLEDSSIYNVSATEFLLNEKLYTVYGIYIHNNIIKYEILFNVDSYTRGFPSHLFEVVDDRLSRYFCFGKSLTGDGKEVILISFREWVGIENRFFYNNLVEGAPVEVALFEKYKNLLELEYQNPRIEESAALLDGISLECPICEHVWEEQKTNFEMCKCPKCSTILLNPLSSI
ncbi:hypothetical protein PV783_18055 [Chitinophaga sp. CC14]|uniref:hypothetical protein n=1 Tax=Chitinophaga sp. CC14 TaxID=3029199 RepID=UPI003B768AD2